MAMLNNQMVYNPDFPAWLKWQVVWIAHFPRGGKHGSDREGRWDMVGPGKAFLFVHFWGEGEGQISRSNHVPSGKHTKNYGKSPFSMGKLTIHHHFQLRTVSHNQRVPNRTWR